MPKNRVSHDVVHIDCFSYNWLVASVDVYMYYMLLSKSGLNVNSEILRFMNKCNKYRLSLVFKTCFDCLAMIKTVYQTALSPGLYHKY